MVKEYKCIKTYPDCQEGVIVRFAEGQYPEYWNIKSGKRYDRKQVEYFPEFWEKIEEPKEYEILSFKLKNTSSEYIRYKNPFGMFPYATKEEAYSGSRCNEFSEKVLSNDSDYVIHSVKRLSDEEVFTIGDLVEHSVDARDKGVIEKFGVLNNQIIGYFRGKNYHTENTDSYLYWNDISIIKHSKKPLFVTEDGKEVFEGDYAYGIDEDFKPLFYSHVPWAKGQSPNKSHKYFSTKEVAEKYIDENKPKYSKKDIRSLLSMSTSPLGFIIPYEILNYLKYDKTK